MSNEEAAAAIGVSAANEVQPPASEYADPAPYEPVETRTQIEVGLQRSVRFGRVIIGAAILGAIIAASVSFFFPLAPDAEYTVAQVAGFMSLIGAAFGLAIGAILALILGQIAKRHRGAAIAVHTDVR
ncbi:hypothetical protein [Leucobacter sp. W1153]|uniref:hypothetical protein n=1 Tax=unclassified Leucobacter TaxID=2621730 RepID=UPI003F326BAE